MLGFSTEYPKNDTVEINVTLEKQEDFEISLRIPAWSKETAVFVNGESVEITNGYTNVKRLWNNGDKIILKLDMRTRIMLPVKYEKDVLMLGIHWLQNYITPQVVYQSEEAMHHIALLRGPLVLARDARLDGTVDEAVLVDYDEFGYVQLTESDKANFKTLVEYQVPTKDNKTFTVIDYSSAGKTWREDSRYACWLPTKKYW